MSDFDPGDGKEKDGKEKVVFRYNRERRLEHAPESVRTAWEKGYTPNKGFLKGLTANAGLRSILVAIVILCIAIFSVTFFGDEPGSAIVDGVPVKLKAFLYDETVYITLTLSATDRPVADPAPASVKLEGLDSDGAQVASDEIRGVYSGTELVLRTTMSDFDVQTIAAAVSLGPVNSTVRVQVDRK